MSTFLFPSHRRPAVLALTLCQIAVLSACGGGSDADIPLASASSTTADNLAAPEAQAQAVRTVSTRTSAVTLTPVSTSTGTTVTAPVATSPAATTSTTVTAAATGTLTNPILFVTQVPFTTTVDMATRLGTFANHIPQIQRAPRGGDLMIRYPDGTLRNLTKEAGFGMDGLQGSKAIAVREPSVHWSGTKALISMVVGAPTRQYYDVDVKWQIYEVTGLAKGATVKITKVANQPAAYNNVSPLYGTDDRILFTSDRPRGGEAHLYPQLDEYESTPTNTGVWRLNPATAELRLLSHSVSGAFTPFIDSAGRIVFTRWDHLKRDQNTSGLGGVNYASEASGAAKLASASEVFPEPLGSSTSSYGPVNGHDFNLFSPWQMNEDGTGEETLNHIGRHELTPTLFTRSFSSDSALRDYYSDGYAANKKTIRHDGGVYQIREDLRTPGTFYGIYGREFNELGASQIVRFTGGVGMNAEQMVFTDASDPTLATGRYRSPTPLADGQMVASYAPSVTVGAFQNARFTVRLLGYNATTRQYSAGTSLTGGISKTVSWWDPDTKKSYSGPLWELDPVEVVARTRPTMRTESALSAPEKAILTEEGISETALRAWMKTNNLALIVTRNQTSRDRADKQQPYNLQVPGGTKKVGNTGKVYDIAHYQILQADSVRGYTSRSGRRPIAQPIPATVTGKNVPNTSGPSGSVKIAADGSTAAFVPANRAVTWQTTDTVGTPVVRERVWITFQPGEVRVCASCHGVNKADQAGLAAPTNKPEALRALVRYWNTLPK